ncbi:Uncharacterised protein [Vibrio cholerae]|nr:Uncharacterised protein [Vibrio cholerae]CSC65987.1 Uncharacterised protein [Vibrio cholerae]CSI59059.1 Uncharacterised protein [Vibrio cholerae]
MPDVEHHTNLKLGAFNIINDGVQDFIRRVE